MSFLINSYRRNAVPNTLQKEYRITSSGSKYLSIPHGSDINFGRTSFWTYSIYVKFPSSMVGTFAVMGSKRAATGAGWQLYKSDAEQCYLVLTGTSSQGAVIRGTATISADQWHLITMVYSGVPASVRFYIDGKDDTTVVNSNNLTSENITNTAALLIGTRLNTPIYADMQVARVMLHSKAVDVNEAPDRLWNYGDVRTGSTISNCVRNYLIQTDTFSGNYLLVDTVSAANGASVNMAGTELVRINSVTTPTPANPIATPHTSNINFIAWDSCGIDARYDIEVSNDGSTGWVKVANTAARTYKHTVGASSTLKYYRILAIGIGSVSAYSSVVSATTLSSSYTDTFMINTLRLGDNSYDFALVAETQRVAPQAYYDSISGRTYFVFMSRAEVGYQMATYIYYYDHATDSFSDIKYVGLKTRQGPDRHPMPAVIVDNSGFIVVAATDFHNEPMQIFRSTLTADISNFTRITEIGVRCDYPQFKKMTNGDLFVTFRSYSSTYTTAGFAYSKSTNGGLTWGAIVDVQQNTYNLGRAYPTQPIQPTNADRYWVNLDMRNDTGGPFPADPDKVGYFKDIGAMYTDDFITWHNVQNSYSKDVVTNGFITQAQWQTNFQYFDSDGTFEPGLATGLVTSGGAFYAAHFRDATHYNVSYHNGTSWVNQNLTFPDSDPDIYSFGYHGIQSMVHISGTTFDIYATKTGVVKRYRTTDNFVTLTLQDSAVLPNILSKPYEHGTFVANYYDTPQKLLYYGIKISSPTPLPTSPGAWADVIIKKI